MERAAGDWAAAEEAAVLPKHFEDLANPPRRGKAMSPVREALLLRLIATPA
ncbi:MAG: hypothetical protein ACLPSW_01050 [Roseiarcus sp.]